MKKIILVVLMIIGVLTFSAWDKGEVHQRTITIGVLPDVDSIPFIMAENQGYFEKAGVKVKLEQFKSAKDRDSALQSGKLDGAIADILTVLFDKAGGFDVKITSKTDGVYKLLAGKNSGIKTLSDLKGKDIAISKNTLIEYATDEMLASVKLGDKDINKEIIPQIPLRLEMLQNGKVDGATLPEPLASVAIKNGAKQIYSTKELALRPGIIMFTGKVLKDNPGEIKAIYKAYNEATDYLNKEPIAKYVDVLVKKAGFPEAIKNSIKLPIYTKASMVEAKDFNSVLNWMVSKKLLKTKYELKACIDSSFVR